MIEITREGLQKLQSFETEGDYRASPSLNFSTLKEIDNGPKCLATEARELTGDAIIIGNYVDAWFTNREHLNDLYEMGSTLIVLPESLEALFQSFVEEGNFCPSNTQCVVRIRQLKLWDNIRDESKLLSRVTANFYDKLRDESKKTGKIRLTADQLAKATYSIDNITHNQAAVDLLAEAEDDEIVLNQFKWEFELTMDSGRKRMFRAMYDKLKFVISQKKIIGIDIKTGAKPSHMFGDSFFEYRYDVQGMLYYFGLIAFAKKYLPDWTIEFKFVYSPKLANSRPIIAELDEDFMNSNLLSFCYKGKEQHGIIRLMNDADWYIENQEFQDHRVLVENDGVISISNLLWT